MATVIVIVLPLSLTLSLLLSTIISMLLSLCSLSLSLNVNVTVITKIHLLADFECFFLLQYPSLSVHKNDDPRVCRPLQSHCSSHSSAATATRLPLSRLASPPLPDKVLLPLPLPLLFRTHRTTLLVHRKKKWFNRSIYTCQHFPKTC